jgi:hypothetical protein
MRVLLRTLAAATLVACGGPTAGDPGYVLVTAEARAGGVELLVEGHPQTSALPIEVAAAADVVTVRAPADRRPTPVEVLAGHLHLVTPSGVRALALDRDVRRDAIEVDAAPEFPRGFASALGARITDRLGPGARLEGPDALVRAAWMNDPREVSAARPVLAGGSFAQVSTAASVPATPAPAAPQPPQSPDPRADLVGVYVSDGAELVLDADGNFSLERPCADTERGAASWDGRKLVLELASGRLELLPREGALASASGNFRIKE